MFFHVCTGQIVDRENTVLSTGLNCHVCDGKTVIHGKVFDSFPNKFHGFIKGSIHTDHSDDMKNHIFSADPFVRLSYNIKFDCRRYFKPCFSGSHAGCHICTSHTSRKCTKCTVCTCMGICTDNHISRNRKSFFRKKCMLYSHLTYIKIVCNIIFAGELAHAFAMLCGFNVFIWSKVIHHKCDFIFVKYTLYIHFSDFMNCNRRSNIIAQNQIQVCLDQLSGADRRQACMCCKNLLSHCHSHG